MRNRLLAVTAAIMMTGSAHAAFIDAPLPANAFIHFKGFDWAWAAPCSPIAGSSCDSTAGSFLSYQGTQGWRLPTAAEWMNAPTATDFQFVGANVPAGGTDAVSGATFYGANGSDSACATPYFSATYHHRDYGDVVYGNPNNLWGGSGSNDTWFVRSTAVPEPGVFVLLGLGVIALGARRRG